MKKLMLWLLILMFPWAACADQSIPFPEGSGNQLIFLEDATGALRLESCWIQEGDPKAREQSYSILPHVILGGEPFYIDGSRPAYWCSHPLQGDAGLLDQLHLEDVPLSFDQIVAQADSSGWAVVSSERWFLTRSLYSEPVAGAAILGEYFPAAPARILADEGDWLRVSIWGREGWMQRQCLAFGQAMLDVAFTVIDEIRLYSDRPIPLYAQPDDSEPMRTIPPEDELHSSPELYIFGLIGDDWLHVATYDGSVVGYVPREYLNPGNG